MKKRLLSILMAAAIVAGTVGTAAAAGADTALDGQQSGIDTGYSDVDPGNPAAADIKAVTDAGYMNGVGGGNFNPDGSVTRAQAITVLGRLAGAAPSDTNDFSDVPSGTWYSGYVGWAVSNGIVEGDGSGRFDPNGLVSGEHLDLMFDRYASARGLDYINFPAMNGETVTRADMAQRLVKLMNAPEDYDYVDKDLWFDTTIYGGFYSAYQIMAGNGDDTFDVNAFVNSRQGELIMSRIKYELCLLGEDQYASQEMIDYWAERGVIETAYLSDEVDEEGYAAHEWLTFVPDYMYEEENDGKTWPVVFSFHGNNNTLFTGVNLGFVDICYDEGFIVVVPEAENSDGDFMVANLESYLDEMEAMGYPIDRSRIYTSGMSKGGRCSMYLAQEMPDVIAAASAHGSSFALDPDSDLSMFEDGTFNAVPLYLACGESDLNQLPMGDVVIAGLNAWSQALGGGEVVAADNML